MRQCSETGEICRAFQCLRIGACRHIPENKSHMISSQSEPTNQEPAAPSLEQSGYRKLIAVALSDAEVEPVSEAEFLRLATEIFTTDAMKKQAPQRTWYADKYLAVLKMRFGFGGEKKKTLKQCGEVFGVSREQIRAKEATALRIMRHPKNVLLYCPKRGQL